MLRVVIVDGKDRICAHALASPDASVSLASLLRELLAPFHRDGHAPLLRHPETATVFVTCETRGVTDGENSSSSSEDENDNGRERQGASEDGKRKRRRRWRCLDRAAVHQPLGDALSPALRLGLPLRLRVQLDPHEGDAARSRLELARQARQQARQQARADKAERERRLLGEQQRAWELDHKPGPSPHELARRRRRERRKLLKAGDKAAAAMAGGDDGGGGGGGGRKAVVDELITTTTPATTTTDDDEGDTTAAGEEGEDYDRLSDVVAAPGGGGVGGDEQKQQDEDEDEDEAAKKRAAAAAKDRRRARLVMAAKWALRAFLALEAVALLAAPLLARSRGRAGRGGRRRPPPFAGAALPSRSSRSGRHRPSVWDSYVGLSSESGLEQAWESQTSSSSSSPSLSPEEEEALSEGGLAARDAKKKLLAYLSGKSPVTALAGVGSEALERAGEDARTDDLEKAFGGGSAAAVPSRERFRESVSDVVASMRQAKGARRAFERASAAADAKEARGGRGGRGG